GAAGAGGNQRGLGRSQPRERRAGAARRGADRVADGGGDQEVRRPSIVVGNVKYLVDHRAKEVSVRISNVAAARVLVRSSVTIVLALMASCWAWPAAAQQAPRGVETVPGMPPVPDPSNLYSETRPDKMSPAVANAL